MIGRAEILPLLPVLYSTISRPSAQKDLVSVTNRKNQRVSLVLLLRIRDRGGHGDQGQDCSHGCPAWMPTQRLLGEDMMCCIAGAARGVSRGRCFWGESV